MKQLGLINLHEKQTRKCDVCVESKLTKKSCSFVQCEFEPLGLIHYDLADLKQTMSKRVYLVRHKDETFNMFLTYKAEVEN
ncbi:hypothetical protein CR513_41515, partial [Mucuna pruriens]